MIYVEYLRSLPDEETKLPCNEYQKTLTAQQKHTNKLDSLLRIAGMHLVQGREYEAFRTAAIYKKLNQRSMSISCIKKCAPGDIITGDGWGFSYIVTQEYSDEIYPSLKTNGYIRLRNMTTGMNTFIAGIALKSINKIIKAPKQHSS